MATKIELKMLKQPAEAVLATIDEQLDRVADSLNQAGFLSAGLRESLMAFVKVAWLSPSMSESATAPFQKRMGEP